MVPKTMQSFLDRVNQANSHNGNGSPQRVIEFKRSLEMIRIGEVQREEEDGMGDEKTKDFYLPFFSAFPALYLLMQSGNITFYSGCFLADRHKYWCHLDDSKVEKDSVVLSKGLIKVELRLEGDVLNKYHLIFRPHENLGELRPGLSYRLQEEIEKVIEDSGKEDFSFRRLRNVVEGDFV